MGDLDSANWEKYYPKDLIVNPTSEILAANTATDKNNFTLAIPNLKINSSYAFQFKYVFEDGQESTEWSPTYSLFTSNETAPAVPTSTSVSTDPGIIRVTLSAFPVNAAKVDVVIAGGSFGNATVAHSFTSAGIANIAAASGVYVVQLRSVSPTGVTSTVGTTYTVTVAGNTVDTTVIPGSPSAITVAAFNETSDKMNRTGFINVNWTAGSGAKGYWVGLWTSNPGNTNPVREIKAEGTFAKVEGLFVGSQYYIQVKSFNEFNNPSPWIAPSSNYPVTIPGNATVPGAVTVTGNGSPRGIVAQWTLPSTAADLVSSGGYYVVKLYTNAQASGAPLVTRDVYSNSATFAGLTTGTSYWVTVQPYTAGPSPVAGTLSAVLGPLIPTAVEPPDIAADFILANNQLQVGGTSGASDIHLSAYTKTVGGSSVSGRIYIGGSESSTSVAAGVYDSSGTPFYADNLGRFSLGDKLSFSGNALSVKGTVDVTGASTFSSYILAGSTSGQFIGIGYQVPNRLADVLKSGAEGISGIVINNASTGTSDFIKQDGTFRLANGSLTFTGGVLTANGTITATSLSANASIASPVITGGEYKTSTNVGNGSTAGIKIDTSGIFAYTASSATPNFSVSNTGVISAKAGSIGSWQINSGVLKSGEEAFPRVLLDPTNSQIVLRETNGASDTGNIIKIDPSIGIRTGVEGNFKFKVGMDGKLEATDAIFTSGTFNGNITSSATISGGTISGATVIGGTISTTTSSSSRRLEISSAVPNRISFFPKSNDDTTIPGYIEIGDDTGSATLPGFKIVTPSASGWAEVSIRATGTPSGGIMNIKTLILNIDGISAFSNWAYNTSNISITTEAFRNISAGTGNPSGGLTGDVYIQF